MLIGELEKIIEKSYFVQSNTLKTALFNIVDLKDMSVLKDFTDSLNKFLHVIDCINHYVFHPKNIWIGLYNSSYALALIVGTTGIILAVMGWKKGLKITGFTVVGYSLIRIIGI